jgi:hypothetical protein
MGFDMRVRLRERIVVSGGGTMRHGGWMCKVVDDGEGRTCHRECADAYATVTMAESSTI